MGAVIERIVPDAGDIGGNHDAGQAGAVPEGIVPDTDDVGGDLVTSRFALRTLNERRVILVEQHPIRTAIGRIGCVHHYCCQAVTELKRQVLDAYHAGRDRNAGKARTVNERIASDKSDTVGNRHAGQFVAAIEGHASDICDPVGDRVPFRYSCRAFNQNGLVLIEQDPIHTAINRIGYMNRYVSQTGAEIERRFPDISDASGDRNAGQVGAYTERIVPDAGDVGADYDVGQAGTVIEGRISNAPDWLIVDLVGDRHRSVGSGVFGNGDRAVVGCAVEITSVRIKGC